MPLQTEQSLTPFELAENRASTFAINLICNAAITETLKVLDTMNLEGRELLVSFKASEGDKKEELKTAISNHIQDFKFLFETVMSHPIEKDA